MPLSCTKTFSVTILQSDFYYWTLNETSGDRIDSAHGVHLHFTPGVDTTNVFLAGDLAMISNGVHLYVTPGNSGSFGPRLDSPALSTPGVFNGFSLAFWFRIVALDTLPHILYLTFSDSSSVQFELGPTPRVRFEDSGFTLNLMNFSAVIGLWYFAHVFYDRATGLAGLSLNNGVQSTTPLSYSSAITGAYLTTAARTLGSNVFFDEMAFKQRSKFTAAQVDYLYNSGSGRTWPIVLP